VSDALDLGVTGIEAALGDHICGLYSNQLQRDQILLPFLEAGLAAGDKCICVVDGTDPKEVVAALDTRVDAAKFAANKQLEVIRAADMYMRSGGFSADEVISSWKAAMSDVMYDGRSTSCGRFNGAVPCGRLRPAWRYCCAANQFDASTSFGGISAAADPVGHEPKYRTSTQRRCNAMRASATGASSMCPTQSR
jgi:hypothetical protein